MELDGGGGDKLAPSGTWTFGTCPRRRGFHCRRSERFHETGAKGTCPYAAPLIRNTRGTNPQPSDTSSKSSLHHM